MAKRTLSIRAGNFALRFGVNISNAPATPTNLACVDSSNERDVAVSWTASTGVVNDYIVEHQFQDIDGEWVSFADVTVSAPTVSLTATAWQGTHRYRVSASNDAGTSTPTSWVSVSVAGGYTAFTLEGSSKIVFVDGDSGNDANSGLTRSLPKKTIAAGVALITNPSGDWLALKCGNRFRDERFGYWEPSGISSTYPVVIRSWTDGTSTARPVVEWHSTNESDAAFVMQGGDATRDYVAIVGIEFYDYTRDPNHASFASSSGEAAIRRYKDGTWFLIEDCKFHFYSGAFSIETGGMLGITTLRIRRNVIVDQYQTAGGDASGMFIASTNGILIEENFLDHNGWLTTYGTQTIRNHNIYMHENDNIGTIIVRKNVSCRASATGIQARSGGAITDNVLINNAVNLSMGHHQVNWPTVKPTGSITGNVIMGGADINGSPRGYGINLARVSTLDVSDNIITHLDVSTDLSSPGGAIITSEETEDVTVASNIIYKWNLSGSGSALNFTDATLGTGFVVDNNDVQMVGGGTTVYQVPTSFGEFTYTNNNYYSSDASPFNVNGTTKTYAQWVTASGETGSANGAVSYASPERTILTYMTSLGGTATVAAFCTEGRLQSRFNWRAAYAAPAVRTYIRAGFGL